MAFDLEAIRKRVDQLQGNNNSSRVQLWKPDIGDHDIRGLPWPDKMLKEGMAFVEREFYYLGDNFGILAPCQFDKPDPINELRQKLWKTGNPDDKNLAKQLRPKMRCYMPIIDRNNLDKGIQIWPFGIIVYRRLLNFFLEKDIENYLDPENGFDLLVKITKQAGKKYRDTTVDVARRQSPLASSPEEIKKLLNSIPDINDTYKVKEYDEIKRILDSWLNGDEPEDTSTGTTRGPTTSNALDQLVKDVQTDKAPVEKKTQKKKPAVTTASLDEAFDELMKAE